MDLVGLLLVLSLTVGVLYLGARRPPDQRRLEAKARRAQRQIDAEYSCARRAMNDAAKQSWRNLTDYDS